MKRGARFAMLALGAVVVAGLLSPLRERFLGRKRLRFPYLSRPIAAAAYDALASKPGWAKAQVEVAPGDGVSDGWHPPRSAPAPPR